MIRVYYKTLVQGTPGLGAQPPPAKANLAVDKRVQPLGELAYNPCLICVEEFVVNLYSTGVDFLFKKG